jgi:hypothetical protein
LEKRKRISGGGFEMKLKGNVKIDVPAIVKHDHRWEKCMFGYTIKTGNYTIRIWKKLKKKEKEK